MPDQKTVEVLVIPVGYRAVLVDVPASLSVLQRLVGGFVEIHAPSRYWHLYSNDGHRHGLTLAENHAAIELVRHANPTWDTTIYGHAALVGIDGAGANTNVPADLVTVARRKGILQ